MTSECKVLTINIMQHMTRSKIPSEELFSVPPNEELSAVEKRKARQDAFLTSLASLGWRKACEAADCCQTDVLRWKRTDKNFAERLQIADSEIAASLEAIVDEIARGEREATPVQVQLLQFRLKALKPETYRERSSVQVDQRTTIALDGDGARAKMLLAEWQM